MFRKLRNIFFVDIKACSIAVMKLILLTLHIL